MTEEAAPLSAERQRRHRCRLHGFLSCHTASIPLSSCAAPSRGERSGILHRLSADSNPSDAEAFSNRLAVHSTPPPSRARLAGHATQPRTRESSRVLSIQVSAVQDVLLLQYARDGAQVRTGRCSAE